MRKNINKTTEGKVLFDSFHRHTEKYSFFLIQKVVLLFSSVEIRNRLSIQAAKNFIDWLRNSNHLEDFWNTQIHICSENVFSPRFMEF